MTDLAPTLLNVAGWLFILAMIILALANRE